MQRREILCIAGFIVCIHSAFAASPAVAPDPTPLLDQGPLGTQLRSTAPQAMLRLEAQIRNLLDRDRRQDKPKGDDELPTPRERAQLAANPALAQAYEKRPVETLRLLRWADDLVQRPRP